MAPNARVPHEPERRWRVLQRRVRTKTARLLTAPRPNATAQLPPQTALHREAHGIAGLLAGGSSRQQ